MAAADTPASWVGSWYAERPTEGTTLDLCRELRVHRADGTMTSTQRCYQKSKMFVERTNTYLWGVDNNVYWTVCRSVYAGGTAPRPCSERYESDVIAASAREIRYRRKPGGVVQTLRRVSDDFRLP